MNQRASLPPRTDVRPRRLWPPRPVPIPLLALCSRLSPRTPLFSLLLAAAPPLPRLTILAYTMPTELPYAADAEEALSYDELEVRAPHQRVSSH